MAREPSVSTAPGGSSRAVMFTCTALYSTIIGPTIAMPMNTSSGSPHIQSRKRGDCQRTRGGRVPARLETLLAELELGSWCVEWLDCVDCITELSFSDREARRPGPPAG